MKIIIAPLVLLFITAAIVYSLRANGVDMVSALGALMIIVGLIIMYRILTAEPGKRQELS